MIVAISGSRMITDKEFISKTLMNIPMGEVREVCHGGAKGVDQIAHDLLEGQVPIRVFPAEWAKHGRAAGPLRNAAMAEHADVLFAIWDGKSRGTLHMIQTMKMMNKPVVVAFTTAEAEEEGYRKLGWKL